MLLHNQFMDLPPFGKRSHCNSEAVNFHLKVLYSLAPATVSALIPPALSLSHCALIHNSPCFFPLL